jgi:hypothetical protein
MRLVCMWRNKIALGKKLFIVNSLNLVRIFTSPVNNSPEQRADISSYNPIFVSFTQSFVHFAWDHWSQGWPQHLFYRHDRVLSRIRAKVISEPSVLCSQSSMRPTRAVNSPDTILLGIKLPASQLHQTNVCIAELLWIVTNVAGQSPMDCIPAELSNPCRQLRHSRCCLAWRVPC